MTIIPLVKYLEFTDFKAFDNNSYIGRDKQFTGRILYHNLEGEFVNGWVYKNGEITHFLKRVQPNEDPVIFLKSSRSLDCQKSKLNQALSEFIHEGCMQVALYNHSESKGITFANTESITSASLKEERFHAWQDAYYEGGIAQYAKVGKVNIEFEAKVFKDIIESPNHSCCWAFMEANDFPENLSTEYSLWIYDIRESIITLQDTDYQKWLNFFNQHNTIYYSPMQDNLSTPKVIKSLMNQSDCY